MTGPRVIFQSEAREIAMPGKRITDHQVNKYKRYRRELGQVASAAKVGISERTARRIEQLKQLPSQRGPRTWRTRSDPLAEVWDAEVLPLLRSAPGLTAVTLLEELQQRHPGRYGTGLLRTLQRRVRGWRALEGAEREVFFAQEHEPGRLGLSDFTDAAELDVHVGGVMLAHRLYQFALAYSGWRHVEVVLGGESFVALSSGLQNALWTLGGVPAEHRTDSLSAAFSNLAEQEDLTRRYEGLCQHYGMAASRNNRGASHENGSIEARHGTLKRFAEQALLLRGDRHFTDLGQYRQFIAAVVARANARVAKALAVERACLAPLPVRRTSEYEEVDARVTKFGLFTVRGALYSAPSRLIGHRLKVRVYSERIEAYLGSVRVVEAARAFGKDGARDRLPPPVARAQAQAGGAGALAAARCAVSSQRVRPDLATADREAARGACGTDHGRIARSGCQPRLRSRAGAAAGPFARCGRTARSGRVERRVCTARSGDADGARAVAVAGAVRPTHAGRVMAATGAISADAARLPIMLTELRMPTIKRMWPAIAEQADREGWRAERVLSVLLEHEMAERETRRLARHRQESALPPDKSIDGFDFEAVPTRIQGARAGADRRRCVARPGRQRVAVRSAGRGQNPSGCGHRPWSDRPRLACAVCTNQRTDTETAGRAARSAAAQRARSP